MRVGRRGDGDFLVGAGRGLWFGSCEDMDGGDKVELEWCGVNVGPDAGTIGVNVCICSRRFPTAAKPAAVD